MAIVKVVPASDTLGDLCTVYNDTCDQVYTSGSSNGTNLTLTKFGGGTTVIPSNVYGERGLSGIFGTGTSISSSAVAANSVILVTWTQITAGTPGPLWVGDIDPGVEFYVYTTSPAPTGNISWAIVG